MRTRTAAIVSAVVAVLVFVLLSTPFPQAALRPGHFFFGLVVFGIFRQISLLFGLVYAVGDIGNFVIF